MPDRLNPQAVFLEHLDTIDRAAARACRKYGLWDEEAEDFKALVKVKLMENEYEVLRKFRGESDWKTFITIVISHLGSGYSRERRGRWRPSTAAERHGPPAPQLEQLVHRDRWSLAEAGEALRTAGVTTLSNLELARLLASLPERAPLRPVEVAAEPVLDVAPADSRADAGIAAEETETWRSGLSAALGRAMAQMTAEEQLIVKWHFAEDRSIADVARALGIEQKPLYRRVPRLREMLRAHLEREGISAREVRELLDRGEA